MSDPIKYSDLFQDDGGIDALIKKINELEKVYANLSKSITNDIKKVQNETKNIDPVDQESIKRIAQLEKQVENLTKKLKENKAARNDIAKLKEKSTRLTGIEAEVEESLKIKIQEQTKELKNSIQMVKLKEGSLKKLKLQLKKNIAAYELLSEKEAAFTSEGKALSKTIRNQKSEIKRLNVALTEEKQKIGEVEKAQNKLKQLETEEAKILSQLKLEIQEKNKQQKQEAILASKNTGAYKRQSIQLNELRKKYKDLAAAGKENTAEGKKMLSSISKLDTKLKQIDQTVGQSQRNVGNYTSVWGRLKNAMSSTLGALGIVTGIAGITRVLGNAINIFKRFEKANSNLQAVLGATTKEMASLQEQAKELGATTAFTANQVTELQTEFARLGFPVRDIQNMTKSTLLAASAMGSQLAEQAQLTGAVLKQFALDSSEAERVNNVLAKSTANSALNFSKLSVAMPIVGVTAAEAGVSLEKTAALLGVLSDRGFEASRSSTALRNIFLKSTKQGLTYEEALTKISQATNKNAASMKLFGVRGATAGVILANASEQVDGLNDSLDNANGTIERMSQTQLDNLNGALLLLNSAWEGFILNIESGKGALGEFLKTTLRVATEVLSLATGTAKAREELNEYQKGVRDSARGVIRFIKVVGVLISSFVSYIATVRLTTSAIKVWQGATLLARGAALLFSKGLKSAALSFRGLNAAMKANPIGLLISLITTLTTTLFLFGKEEEEEIKKTDELTDSIDKLESKFRSVNKVMSDVQFGREAEVSLAEMENTLSALEDKLKNFESLPVLTIPRGETESLEDFSDRLDEVKRKNKESIVEDIALIKQSIEDRKKEISELGKQKGLLQQIEDKEKDLKEKRKKQRNEDIILAQTKELEELQKRREDLLGVTAEKNEKANEKLLAQAKKLNDAITLLEIEDAEERAIKKLEIAAEAEKAKIDLIKEASDEEKLIAQEAIDDKLFADKIKVRKEFNDKQLGLDRGMLDKIRELRESNIAEEIKSEEDKELALLKFRIEKERDAIKASEADKALKRKAELELDKQHEIEKAKIQDRFNKEREEKERQERIETRDFIVGQAFEAIERIQQKEEDRIERQIEGTDRQISRQQELAKEGLENTLAFEEAERAKLELKKLQNDKKQIRLEKIKALYSAYSSAASSGDDQAITKVIRDFAIIQGLEASLTSFGSGTGQYGTIEDAIDARTGGSSNGNSLSGGIFRGKKHNANGGDGIPVLVEGGEGILSTDQMNKFGKDNFMKLTQSLDSGVLGSDFFGNQIGLVPQQSVLNVNLDGLRSEMNSVKKAIENKPVQQVDVDSLSKSYTDFVETKIVGNKKTISRYRVNKKRL